MSANLEEIVVTGRTFPNFLALPKSAKIGDLEVETNIEEVHTDTLEITEHPVERGAAITDHSYKRPTELVLRCGWSNASRQALFSIVKGALSGATMVRSDFVEGSQTRSDYVGGIYSRLLKLQESREPLTVTTSLRQYDSMLIKSLAVTRDRQTSQALMVEVTLRQVIFVSTQSATLAPKESQADPASTAETENAGTKNAIPAIPAPGGSVPPNKWTH